MEAVAEMYAVMPAAGRVRHQNGGCLSRILGVANKYAGMHAGVEGTDGLPNLRMACCVGKFM